MAKGNMLLGLSRGKLGDLVFYRANGQQAARVRQRVVKNPQTEAQMIQRIILATISQAYSKMSAIVDHSFEGIQEGAKSMAHFNKVNMAALRASAAAAVDSGESLYDVFAFTPVGRNEFQANDYIIAKGSLPQIAATITSNKAVVVIGNGDTYQDVCNKYGLQRGDQLTFCTIEAKNVAGGFGFDFAYSRVILDPTNTDGSEAPMSSAFYVYANNEYSINLPSPRNLGSFRGLMFTATAGGVQSMEFGILPNGLAVVGAAVIVSRKVDGMWKRSNATITCDAELVTAWDAYSLGEALDLLNGSDISTLSPRYLNNAGQGRLPSSEPAVHTYTTLTANGKTFAADQNKVVPTGDGVAAIVSGSDISLGNIDSSDITAITAAGGAVTQISEIDSIESSELANAIGDWFTPAIEVSPVIRP